MLIMANMLWRLAKACDGCLNGEFSALVTGPVHKGIINDAACHLVVTRNSLHNEVAVNALL